MTGARLLGLGAHLPAQVVTNADLVSRLDTSDAWIRERTGIERRHAAAADETVVSMGSAAAAKALAASGVDAADVDLTLLATCTMTRPIPGGAAAVATSLGATRTGAADVNAGCASFCYALAWAADAVAAGSARHVLVVGSERLSTWVDADDRATAVIFGDGAGAAVVGAAAQGGIGRVVWGSDGSRSGLIAVADDERHVRMDGPAVFRWATSELADVARAACAAVGVAPDELAGFIPHQANLRIVDALARRLGIPSERVSRDVVDVGNTSSASVPIALSRFVESGRVTRGEPVLLFAFGAGLSYAAQVVTAP